MAGLVCAEKRLIKYNKSATNIMPELVAGSPGEHINEEELMRRFEEKKRLLEHVGGKAETKEIFREAFREEAEKITPSVPQTPVAPTTATAAPSLRDDSHTAELQALVGLALEKGITEAVRKAKAETPYLIDALHDELADHYYEKLIAAGKLWPE